MHINSANDSSYLTTWHVSLGNAFVEVSFYNTPQVLAPELNNAIAKQITDLSDDDKHKLTYILVNKMPFVKPDESFQFNFNPREIEFHFTKNSEPLVIDLNKLVDHACISADRIYKFINTDSNLIGQPFPEKVFQRVRVNLKTYIIQRPHLSSTPSS